MRNISFHKLSVTALACLMLRGAAAQAEAWVPIGQTETGTEMYLDRDSVRRTGSRVNTRMRMVVSDAEATKRRYAQIDDRIVFDCREGTFQIRSEVLYRRDGSIAGIDERPAAPSRVAPGSAFAQILGDLCAMTRIRSGPNS